MRKLILILLGIYSTLALTGCNRQTLAAVLRGVGNGMGNASREASCNADPNCINVNVR